MRPAWNTFPCLVSFFLFCFCFTFCPFCPLFRGTGFCPLQTAPGRKSGKPADLCCVFCCLFRRWIFHRKKSRKPAFFLGTAVRNVLFSHPFCCFLGYGSPGLYPGCQISHGIRRVCLWRNPWGNAQFLRSISSNSSPIRNTRLPKNTKISPRLKITFFSLLNSMEK